MKIPVLTVCALLLVACGLKKVEVASLTGCAPERVRISDRADGGYDVSCNGDWYICAYTGIGKSKTLNCSRENDGLTLETAPAGAPPPPQATPAGPPLAAAPTGLVGFTFGQSPQEAEATCSAAGHAWSAGEGEGRWGCSGPPTPPGIDLGGIELVFCEEKLCEVVLESADQPVAYMRPMNDLKATLTAKYGKGTPRVAIQSGCLEEENAVRCLKEGHAKVAHFWKWPTGHRVTLSVVMGENAPRLRLHYVGGINPGAL